MVKSNINIHSGKSTHTSHTGSVSVAFITTASGHNRLLIMGNEAAGEISEKGIWAMMETM